MLDFDRFAYTYASLPKDESEKKKLFQKLEEQFQEEIRNSEHAQQYFSNYGSVYISSFIKSYAAKKIHLAQCYSYYADKYHEKEISELSFQKKAENALEVILQKKLFNMQLLWRAGQLEIDGIKTSYEFNFWERHILSCPFIEPVQKKEVELMKDYLMQSAEEEDFDRFYHSWQNYDEITKRSNDGSMDEVPEWYEFYDLRMGTGVLLILPNRKGEKEDFYLRLVHKESTKDKPPQVYQPQKPILFSGPEELYDFSKYFETDKYFIALFKYYNYHYEQENRNPNYDDINGAVELLFSADRPVYLNSNLTWDNAIMAAAKEYSNTKTAEMLDFVYEQYLMMKDLGISGHETREEVEEAWAKDFLINYFRTNIPKGKLLNGEPEDFDF